MTCVVAKGISACSDDLGCFQDATEVSSDSAHVSAGTTTRRKNSKVHHGTGVFVRSVRVGSRVIQQTVAHLGELDEQGRFEARSLSRQLIGAPEQSALFNDDSERVPATVPVRLKGDPHRAAAPDLAACIWRSRYGVGWDLRGTVRRVAAGRQGARCLRSKMAAVLVLRRSSASRRARLHIAEGWYRRTRALRSASARR